MQIGAMNNPREPLLDEIHWFAANAFDYIDLTIEAPGAAAESTNWPAVAAVLRDLGLGVVCHTAPYLPIHNPSPLVRHAAVDELRRSIDAAQILGATLCTMHFMGWPDYFSDAQGYEFYRQMLEILVRHGNERGVAVAMENSPDNRHQHKYFREIFARVPGLKLLFDIGHGHLATSKSMTREYLFSLNDRLAHIHISDNNGVEDLHLPFGAAIRGGMDLAANLRALRYFRYDGTITLEVFGDRRWLLACREQFRAEWERAAPTEA
ncbi:MAG: sugar phosphate isomerase/epimerase [Caldilineaceae bacterium]|nr:sugar phosphate isomerase/epimerase [Caldilineaceae bacterium]HRJ43339.1 sugar phosphate isomerase/epimerase family protein [Caldilineaceae bacterium]